MQDVINRAVEVLKEGGLILYPTDTLWGIGCDATNPAAVDKIYKLKRSADKKGMLVLVGRIDDVARYASDVPEVAWQMLELTEDPLTLILSGAHGVAANLIPDEGTIGIRVPAHQFCEQLLRKFGRALVSTSANISGEQAPSGFGGISREIVDGVDFVVPRKYEGGMTGKPSSIVALSRGGEVKIIRE